jgi:hypothetical protein
VLLGTAANGIVTDAAGIGNAGFETNTFATTLTNTFNPSGFNVINAWTSGTAGSPSLTVWETGTTGYHQMAFGKVGANLWQFGVGQSAETGLGVAGKLFFYDSLDTKVAMSIDTGDRVEIGRTGVLPANFPALLSVGTTSQFQVNTTGDTTAASVKTTVYTVATLPSAATLGAGAHVVVSDGAGTPPTCTGGGSNYQIALSNGTTWTCH